MFIESVDDSFVAYVWDIFWDASCDSCKLPMDFAELLAVWCMFLGVLHGRRQKDLHVPG